MSLRCGILKQAKLLSSHLYNLSQHLYDQLRDSSGHLRTTIDQIKERLCSELAKLNPAVSKHPKIQEAKPAANLTNQTITGISLSQLSTKFLNAKNEAGYPSKTVNGYHDTHKLAISVLGDVAIDSLTHGDGRNFVEVLKKLPVNRSKSYSKLTIKELLKLEDIRTLSYKTILKHTERVSALINWAIKQGYTSQNVFRGKLEPIRKVETVEKHFTDQELNLILYDALKTESLAQNKPERSRLECCLTQILCLFNVGYCIYRIKHEIGSNEISLVKSLKQDLKSKRMTWNVICPSVFTFASAEQTPTLGSGLMFMNRIKTFLAC